MAAASSISIWGEQPQAEGLVSVWKEKISRYENVCYI